MAIDAFLKIDCIEGESRDDKHADWIEIIRFGVGVRQTASITASSAGGATAERTDFSDFMLRKLLDKSSPKLALTCAASTHIDRIVVDELGRAGTEKLPYMPYTLKDCLISRAVTTSGSDVGGEFPAETVKLNFGRIEWCYSVQNRKGGEPMGNVAGGWDQQRNCRL